MNYFIVILLFVSSLCATGKDSFITEQEYARHLYKNPRGIGCDNCHGKYGEGITIARYKDKGKEKTLKTKSIKELTYNKFKRAFELKQSIMPKYFLTDSEIRALYMYLHKKNMER